MAKLNCPKCPDFDGFASVLHSPYLKLHHMNGVVSI